MTKQETIQKAYGEEHWESVKDFVDENGRLKVIWGHISFYPQYAKLALAIKNSKIEFEGDYYARPKSLRGIEDNNGWLDLPTKELLEYGFYFVKVKHPETLIEDIFVHEIKDGAGIIPYAYAIQYKKIELKLPIY